MRRIAVFFFTLLAVSVLSGQDQGVKNIGPSGLRYTHFLRTELIINRFLTPNGYHFVDVEPGSFGRYLQTLPLKPPGSEILTCDGEMAFTNAYTAAVIDMNMTTTCKAGAAAVVMRLRSEYLYRQKRYDKIAFHFDNGFLCDFGHYAEGCRYLNGHWVMTGIRDYGYPNFIRYMNFVFANTCIKSLKKDLKKVGNTDDVKAGDVFIRDTNPAHCFIVMHVIENKQRKRQFLLAQGFTPAQDIQMLRYDDGPWFNLDTHSNMLYGELINRDYLHRFED